MNSPPTGIPLEMKINHMTVFTGYYHQEILRSAQSEHLDVFVLTDKTNYTGGDLVEISLCVTNMGSEDVELVFPTTQLCDSQVLTKDQTVVYTWSNGRFFPQVETSVLIPNHTTVILLKDEWNQCDDNGTQIPGGEYYVDGFIVDNYVTNEIHGDLVGITIQKPTLDITLIGRYLFRHPSIAVQNSGDGVAYDLNWTFDISIPYLFWGLYTTHLEGGKEMLKPGEEFTIELGFTRVCGIGMFEITLSAYASNAAPVSETYQGFIVGSIILFMALA